ncbi:DUF4283 domain protein, partial [Trifolium medium]|nr:DUF4283 domain protein [Trifolium medium]
MNEAKDWLEQWFRDIRLWNPKEVDNERIVWLRAYGIPVHAWNDGYFSAITASIGTFINVDDCTMKMDCMDVARLMVRTQGIGVVDTIVETVINGDRFDVRLIEDSYGPMRVVVPSKQTEVNNNAEDEESDDESEEIPSWRQHGVIGEEEVNENSFPIIVNDKVTNLQEEDMEGFDEERENKLALIAFKPNSNLDEGESTNNATEDKNQDE